MENDGIKTIGISKKGGHIVSMNYYRESNEEKISEEEAVEIGKKFLNEKGYKNMKETYYMKQSRKYCNKLRIYARRSTHLSRFNKSKNCIR